MLEHKDFRINCRLGTTERDVLSSLESRSLEILSVLTRHYLRTGRPVGSAFLSKNSPLNLCPSSIRGIMHRLQDLNVLFMPHTSAGRLPTELGLKIFVSRLLKLMPLSARKKKRLKDFFASRDVRYTKSRLETLMQLISELSGCVCLILLSRLRVMVKRIEIVPLSEGKILLLLIMSDGSVEDRLITDFSSFLGTENLSFLDIDSSCIEQVCNYLNSVLRNRRLKSVKDDIFSDIRGKNLGLSWSARKLLECIMLDLGSMEELFTLRSYAEDGADGADIEVSDKVIENMRKRQSFLDYLGEEQSGTDMIHIFIGSCGIIFDNKGYSMVISPFGDERGKVLGALGIIGSECMHYESIAPMVGYASGMLGYISRGQDLSLRIS